MKENATNDRDQGDQDVGEDLQITRITQRGSVPGTWVCGTLSGHRFEALVFPEHAENNEYEIGDSQISKLWLQRISDRQVVFNWDRGADITAADQTAQAIVDFLCAGLAESTYGD